MNATAIDITYCD